LEIRKATIQDANRISYLIRKNTDGNPNDYDKAQLDAWKKYNTPAKIKKQLANRDLFCAFENEKLIGTIGLQGDKLVGFYISFSKRKKGIGSKLYDFIEEEAKQRNIKTLYLTATPSAVSFYKSRNFQKIEDVIVTIYDIDYEEIDMKKSLH